MENIMWGKTDIGPPVSSSLLCSPVYWTETVSAVCLFAISVGPSGLRRFPFKREKSSQLFWKCQIVHQGTDLSTRLDAVNIHNNRPVAMETTRGCVFCWRSHLWTFSSIMLTVLSCLLLHLYWSLVVLFLKNVKVWWFYLVWFDRERLPSKYSYFLSVWIHLRRPSERRKIIKVGGRFGTSLVKFVCVVEASLNKSSGEFFDGGF